MGIAVNQLSGSEKRAGGFQFFDDGRIRVSGFAVFVIDTASGKHRDMVEKPAVRAHGFRDVDAMTHAQFPVVGAMTRSDMNKAGSGFDINEIRRQQRDFEIVPLAVEGVTTRRTAQFTTFQALNDFERFDTGRFGKRGQKSLGDDEAVALGGGTAACDPGHFDDRVIDVFSERHRAIAGDSPGRRCPDHHSGAPQVRIRGALYGETDENRGRRMIVVFHLRLGQGRLLDHRPHHRLGALVQGPVHQELAEFTDDLRLGAMAHGGVRVIPVADDTETLEFGLLDFDPFSGEFAALAADLRDGNVILVDFLLPVPLLDLPLDRKSVAIPTRDVVGVFPEHLLRAIDHVLEDLVEGVTDMQVPVRVRRAIVKNELLPAVGDLAVAAVKVDGLPTFQDFRLAFRQTRLHGKGRMGKEDGRFVVHSHDPACFPWSPPGW